MVVGSTCADAAKSARARTPWSCSDRSTLCLKSIYSLNCRRQSFLALRVDHLLRLRRGFLLFVECFLEAANRLPQSFAQLRQLLRAEDEQSNAQYDQQMYGLKQAFKHGAFSFRSIRASYRY